MVALVCEFEVMLFQNRLLCPPTAGLPFSPIFPFGLGIDVNPKRIHRNDQIEEVRNDRRFHFLKRSAVPKYIYFRFGPKGHSPTRLYDNFTFDRGRESAILMGR